MSLFKDFDGIIFRSNSHDKVGIDISITFISIDRRTSTSLERMHGFGCIKCSTVLLSGSYSINSIDCVFSDYETTILTEKSGNTIYQSSGLDVYAYKNP